MTSEYKLSSTSLEILEEDFPIDYDFNDQDLRIVKVLLHDKKLIKGFLSGQYSIDFFQGKSKLFAQEVLNYFKVHQSLPTKRILNETLPEKQILIEEVYQRLQSIEVDPIEFVYDLDKIKNRYAKEQYLQLRDINFDDPDWEKNLKKIEQQASKIKDLRKSKEKEYHIQSGKEYAEEFVNNYQQKLADPEFDRGTLTGYSYFDYITNGLHETDLLMICAESGAGKSILMNNMAVQMWMQKNTLQSKDFSQGCNIMYFTLEMPFKNCFRRTIAKMADIPVNGIRDAKLNPDEIKKFVEAAQFFKRYDRDFHIIDVPRGLTVEKLEEIYLTHCEGKPEEKKPKGIVIDYIGLMGTEDHQGGDDWLKFGKIAGDLHEFLRTYGLWGISGLQLNRAPQNKKEESDLVGLHRIGRSSIVAHHCTHVLQILSRENEKVHSDFPYFLIKTRDGEQGSALASKNFRNSSIIDIPFHPEQDDLNGFAAQEDFSDFALNYLKNIKL